ncbi:hypothetical protein AB0C02_29465 [Micromonospora sp. NPDC048999]|uniref:hypothetical protein n=1 Tax=Micromonospora sp. NPDC048999 TaxID=3155391 RepID=UPI0033F0E473
MDVPELLDRAAPMVPASATNDAGATVADVRQHVQHNDWGLALDLLANLDGWPAGAQWWDLLIEAAELMWLTDTAAWCRCRRWESIHGVIRAELTLVSVADGGRRIPIPGKGVLRPLWHIGQHMPEGHRNLRVARIWVENAPELTPGATGMIRLAPLSPEAWRDLRRAQTITMHEGLPVRGTATITEISTPR